MSGRLGSQQIRVPSDTFQITSALWSQIRAPYLEPEDTSSYMQAPLQAGKVVVQWPLNITFFTLAPIFARLKECGFVVSKQPC